MAVTYSKKAAVKTAPVRPSAPVGGDGNARILTGALDEADGKIILRGVLDQETLGALLTDDYQRESLQSLNRKSSLTKAFEKGERVPDIELGMRGSRVGWRDGDDTFTLKDPVYIIDGVQRISAARTYLSKNPGGHVHIGAAVHFNTTKEWEKERFVILNTMRVPVSPNIMLRNMRETSNVVLTLYGLCNNDPTFPFYRRVSWNQRMARGEMITATTLFRTMGFLHAHRLTSRSTRVSELVQSIDKSVDRVGLNAIRQNMHTFANVLDEAFGIRTVEIRDLASWLRGSFLWGLAIMFSEHKNFWEQPGERKLIVDRSTIKKLGTFPIRDPNISHMAQTGGQSRYILSNVIRDHINSNRRTNRLVQRAPVNNRGNNLRRGTKEDDET